MIFSPDQILYEDNHLIIVNKHAGQLVQGDKSGDLPISEALKSYIKIKCNKPGNVYLGVPHRIDRPTSGICMFARTSKMLTRLNELFATHQIQKTYHAIVTHLPDKKQDTLIHYLKKIEQNNFAKVYHLETPNTKKAILHYKYIKSVEQNHLLEIQLETGRHHQIRAQLSAIGSAIYGDLKYGSKFHMDRNSIALHSTTCAFVHPVSQEQIEIYAPYPEKKLWSQFVD